MSWDRTYTHTLAIGVDILSASVFWNSSDVTISTLCRVVQLADSGDEVFRVRLAALDLAGWQTDFLRWLAQKLDWIQAGHCELARQADLARATSAAALLVIGPTDSAAAQSQGAMAARMA